MSTILRSLKRLEKEKESRVSQDLALLTAFNTHQSMNRAVKFEWLRKKEIRWGLPVLFVILVAGAFYAFNRSSTLHHKILPPQAANRAHPGPVQEPVDKKNPHPKSSAQSDQSAQQDQIDLPDQQDIQTQVIPPQPMPPDGVPNIKPMAIPQVGEELAQSKEAWQAAAQKAAAIADGSSPPQGAVSSRPPLDNSAVPFAPSSAKQPDQSNSPSANPLVATDSAGPARLPKPEGKHASSQPATQPEDSLYANAERMTDGRLKVQAIVWALRAEDRMAVINNRIVREGAVIDSFTIVGIGEDAVYVREEGMRLLKVPFGY